MINNFKEIDPKINELHAGFSRMLDKVNRLKDLINNADVVRWDVKKEDIIIKEEDKRDSRKHFI